MGWAEPSLSVIGIASCARAGKLQAQLQGDGLRTQVVAQGVVYQVGDGSGQQGRGQR